MDSWQINYFVKDSITDRYQTFLFEKWTGLLVFPIGKNHEIRIIVWQTIDQMKVRIFFNNNTNKFYITRQCNTAYMH